MSDDEVAIVARAIEAAETEWLRQKGDALDGLAEEPELTLPKAVARAAIKALDEHRAIPIVGEVE